MVPATARAAAAVDVEGKLRLQSADQLARPCQPPPLNTFPWGGPRGNSVDARSNPPRNAVTELSGSLRAACGESLQAIQVFKGTQCKMHISATVLRILQANASPARGRRTIVQNVV